MGGVRRHPHGDAVTPVPVWRSVHVGRLVYSASVRSWRSCWGACSSRRGRACGMSRLCWGRSSWSRSSCMYCSAAPTSAAACGISWRRAARSPPAGADGRGDCADLGGEPRLVDSGGRRPLHRFPLRLRGISTRFHAPLLALLLAIVARGSAFAFRSASGDADARAARVERPLHRGQRGGAVAARHDCGGAGQRAGGRRLSPQRLGWSGPWLTPFALAAGLFTLALCAFLAAVYLTVEAEGDPSSRRTFAAGALASGIACGVLALATFCCRRGRAARPSRASRSDGGPGRCTGRPRSSP